MADHVLHTGNMISKGLYSRQKAALTRAVNSGDANRVIAAVRTAVRQWNTVDGARPQGGGQWPDDWARWQRALDDVGLYVALEDL